MSIPSVSANVRVHASGRAAPLARLPSLDAESAVAVLQYPSENKPIWAGTARATTSEDLTVLD